MGMFAVALFVSWCTAGSGGAFAGHTQLLQAACEMYGQPGDAAFELSVGNADKLGANGRASGCLAQGLLPLPEVERRIAQFVEAGLPLLVTRAPLFVHKATLLRNSQFVVGWDTAVRMVMPKYYDDSEVEMMLVFERSVADSSITGQGVVNITDVRWLRVVLELLCSHRPHAARQAPQPRLRREPGPSASLPAKRITQTEQSAQSNTLPLIGPDEPRPRSLPLAKRTKTEQAVKATQLATATFLQWQAWQGQASLHTPPVPAARQVARQGH
ncbi:uncharacterized protein HaLaN_11584 [Haematococcus lacustris]|uniref:Uncharacterized protein n=1 Tax=Haematococcus lacustris TaxID=44745 RepID=A0A699Z8C6_HAELA|nr:uncharacterized protein HaLaN_11584 [Haematococcus lacustris]